MCGDESFAHATQEFALSFFHHLFPLTPEDPFDDVRALTRIHPSHAAVELGSESGLSALNDAYNALRQQRAALRRVFCRSAAVSLSRRRLSPSRRARAVLRHPLTRAGLVVRPLSLHDIVCVRRVVDLRRGFGERDWSGLARRCRGWRGEQRLVRSSVPAHAAEAPPACKRIPR